MNTLSILRFLLLISSVSLFLVGCKDNDPYVSNANPQVIGWIPMVSGTSQELTSASYATPSVIYLAGFAGTVLHSNDGGKTWSLIQTPTKADLYCIHFGDANTGVVLGDSGIALFTTNGGATWAQTFNKPYRFSAVSFSDPLNGTAVGSKGPTKWDSGIVIRTTNGGSSWVDQSSNLNSWNSFYGVSFIDANNGFVGGFIGRHEPYQGGALYITSDAGLTWRTDTVTSDGFSCYSIAYTDLMHGTLVGNNSRLYQTTNGGTSWQLKGFGLGYLFLNICFSDPTHGTAVGDYGKIVKTTNGGATWQIQSDGGPKFNASAWSDNLHGIIVGESGTILTSLVQ